MGIIRLITHTPYRFLLYDQNINYPWTTPPPETPRHTDQHCETNKVGHIQRIVNKSNAQGVHLDSLKTGKVKPIYKGERRTDLSVIHPLRLKRHN